MICIYWLGYDGVYLNVVWDGTVAPDLVCVYYGSTLKHFDCP